MALPRRTSLTIVQVALRMTLGAGLCGCASTSSEARVDAPVGARATIAAPYGQWVPRAQAVSVRVLQPLLGEDEWAVPTPPMERPVRFHRWRQW